MATTQQATRAPGKAMLIGEYAVLDGAPAVVAAVDCYAVGRLCPGEPGSPFIACAMSEASAALAELGVSARPPAGLVPVVDTQSFSVNGRKLGVGSSASATVAAVGALLAAAGVAVDERACQRVVQRAATRAHDAAQGVRGSGAISECSGWQEGERSIPEQCLRKGGDEQEEWILPSATRGREYPAVGEVHKENRTRQKGRQCECHPASLHAQDQHNAANRLCRERQIGKWPGQANALEERGGAAQAESDQLEHDRVGQIHDAEAYSKEGDAKACGFDHSDLWDDRTNLT